jgi:hypothetical protein
MRDLDKAVSFLQVPWRLTRGTCRSAAHLSVPKILSASEVELIDKYLETSDILLLNKAIGRIHQAISGGPNAVWTIINLT